MSNEKIRSAYQNLVNETMTEIKSLISNMKIQEARDLCDFAGEIMCTVPDALEVCRIITKDQANVIQDKYTTIEELINQIWDEINDDEAKLGNTEAEKWRDDIVGS